jgi:uncharacterized protein YndB with AHSA1/START domain
MSAPVNTGTFALERTYKANPAKVWGAWSSEKAKGGWFMPPPTGGRSTYRLDFRVGGREVNEGDAGEGFSYKYDALYFDIIPDERIIYAYEMYFGGARVSASLATIELKPDGTGTRLKITEQGAFFDGTDSPQARRAGTEILLRNLSEALGEPDAA